MGIRWLLRLAVLALPLAAACATPPALAPPSPGSGNAPATLSELAGGEWQLASLRWEGKEIALATESRPTLAVEETGKVWGLATLNRYFGQVELRAGGELHWAGPLGSTMMAGPEPLMNQEMSFLQALQSTRRASLRNGVLVLEGEDGRTVMEFRR